MKIHLVCFKQQKQENYFPLLCSHYYYASLLILAHITNSLSKRTISSEFK